MFRISRSAEDEGQRGFGRLLQVYIPIRFGSGPVVGAFEIYETYGPLATQINQMQIQTSMIVGGDSLAVPGAVRHRPRRITNHFRPAESLEAACRRTGSELYGYHQLAGGGRRRARSTNGESISERVTGMALRLGTTLVSTAASLRQLEIGSQLHDIGKIGVPDATLRKPGPLTDDEWTKIALTRSLGTR